MQVTMNMRDPKFAENAEAIRCLESTGKFTSEELQKMYDEQVAKDIEEATTCQKN